MRLAVLMPTGTPWARQLVAQLCRLGHTVHVIDFRPFRQRPKYQYLSSQDTFQAESIALFRQSVAGVHELDSRFDSAIRYFSCARKVRQICRDCNAEILLSVYGGGWGVLAWMSGVSAYAVYVVGSDVLRFGSSLRWVKRRSLENAAVVFANGGYLAEQTRLFAPRAKVVPLVLGTDTQRFCPGAAPPSPVKIVCTRGFSPVYDNEAVLRGVLALRPQHTDVQMTFTSSGPMLDAVRRVAEQACPADPRKTIAFLGGVSDDELLGCLQSSHIYVSLSRSDGTSISLLEALACGLFPILSDIPQNREWVDPALNNGLLVPLDDFKALAAALEKAIADPSLRARAAPINRQLALQRADAAKNMSLLTSTLETLLAARTGA